MDGKKTLGLTALVTVLDILSDLMGMSALNLVLGASNLLGPGSSRLASRQYSHHRPEALVPEPVYQIWLGNLPVPLHIHGNLRYCQNCRFPLQGSRG